MKFVINRISLFFPQKLYPKSVIPNELLLTVSRACENVSKITNFEVNEIHEKNSKTSEVLGSQRPFITRYYLTVPLCCVIQGSISGDGATSRDRVCDKSNLVGVASWRRAGVYACVASAWYRACAVCCCGPVLALVPWLWIRCQ